MPIRRRLIILFLSIAIIPIFFIALLNFSNAKDELLRARTERLGVIADLKVDKIEHFFNDLKGDIRLAQDYFNIKTNLPIVTKYSQDRLNPEYIKAKTMLDGQLRTWLKVREELVDFVLVSPEGKVVYTANEAHAEHIGGSLPDPTGEAFQEGKKRIYVSEIFKSQASGYDFGMFVTAPAYNFDNKFIGVIALEINMDPIYSFIQDTTGLDQSGETLIVQKKISREGSPDYKGRDGEYIVYLNSLRHDSEAALKRIIFMGDEKEKPAQMAVKGEKGSGFGIDYRGKKVLASWRYIPSLNWGLVAKMDMQEILAPVNALKYLTIIICVIVGAIVWIIALVISNSISAPIHILHKGTEIVGSGNLDYKVATDARDEIGQLSRAFDEMTSKLKAQLEETKAANHQLKASNQQLRATEQQLRVNNQQLKASEQQLRAANQQLRANEQQLRNEITRRKKLEEEIQRNYDIQTALNSLLYLSLEDITLEDVLNRTLELILSIPWLALESRGGIFLVGDDPNTLVMKAQNKLAEPIQKSCALVPFGKCLCGQAALTQKVQFADHLDARHEIRYEGIIPHGHYCVPILFAGRTLGVINLYVREGHRQDQREEDFLAAIANTLAGIIQRKKTEEELIFSNQQLRASEQQLQATNQQLKANEQQLRNEISERLQIEASLRQAHKEEETILASVQAFIFYKDIKNKFVRVNHALAQALGYSEEELNGKSLFDIYPREVAEKYWQDDLEVIASGKPKLDIIEKMETPQGMRWLQTDKIPYVDEENKIIGVIGFAMDITDRKKAEDALRHAAEEWKATFDSISDLVFLIDKNRKILRVNKSFADRLNLKPQEVIGKDCCEIMHFISEPSAQRAICQVAITTKKTENGEFFEPRLNAYFDITASPILDTNGEVTSVVLFAKDITERKKMQKNQRFIELGKLVADMAHEVNNPLMIISGNAQLSLMEEIQNKEVENNLKIIFEESKRAKDIIQRLLKFSRSSKGEIKQMDINQSIESVVTLLEHQFNLSNVEVKRDYAPALTQIFADEKQLQEVFMNLLNNARDAMSGGGKIEITTSQEGGFVRIDFKDTGCGMTEEVKAKLFEPFFTTKEKGTGLGLSVCYGIIKAHNGELTFESQPQKGTTATILLPFGGGG